MISSQKLWPLDHEAGLCHKYEEVKSVSVSAPLFSEHRYSLSLEIESICLLSSYMFRPELGHLRDLKFKKKRIVEDNIKLYDYRPGIFMKL